MNARPQLKIRPRGWTRASLVVLGGLLLCRTLWPYLALRYGIPTITFREVSTLTYDGHDANFPGVLLPFARLAGASLGWANLAGANLFHADLSRCDLSGANLSRATLTGTNLTRANLSAYKDEGRLVRVYLFRADLRRARLCGANLCAAHLQAADLCGADLRGARLNGANLTGAIYDARTRWPASFDPHRHGAVLDK